MGARVTMRPTALTPEMLTLLAHQAEGTESFTLPGAMVIKLVSLARQTFYAHDKPRETAPARAVNGDEFAELVNAARTTVRFLSLEQRNALRVALVETL